jgi:hypothetical protein
MADRIEMRLEQARRVLRARQTTIADMERRLGQARASAHLGNLAGLLAALDDVGRGMDDLTRGIDTAIGLCS